MLNVGIGQSDITPPVGLPLSGFAVRQNKPSTAIDDPLFVKAMIFSSGDENVLLLSYDLLGFDQELDQAIRDSIFTAFGDGYFKNPVLITTTHTHSTPPTMPIAGETRVPGSYIQKIINATHSAVSEARANLVEVNLFHASTELEGINLNRRQLQFPLESSDRFPFDPTFDLWVFKTRQGHNQAILVRFSCHAVTRCDMSVSADYPGELTRRLEAALGATCLFLEGTAGDTNPTISAKDSADVQLFVDRILAQIQHLPNQLGLCPVNTLALKTVNFNLPLAPLPPKESILERITQNNRILAGDTISPDLQPLIAGYAGWRFPDDPDIKGTVQHWAAVGNQSAELTLQAIDRGLDNPPVTFSISALSLGPLTLLFLSGEVLTTMGRQITGQFPDKSIKVISYLSPIVGYIGTQEDFRIGGYEPDSSSTWYRQPGPFRADIDRVIKKQVKLLLGDNP